MANPILSSVLYLTGAPEELGEGAGAGSGAALRQVAGSTRVACSGVRPPCVYLQRVPAACHSHARLASLAASLQQVLPHRPLVQPVQQLLSAGQLSAAARRARAARAGPHRAG